MSRLIDAKKVQESLDRAAHSARFGPPSARAGRFDQEEPAQMRLIAQKLLRFLQEQKFVHRETRGDLEIWHDPVTRKSVVVPMTGISSRNANAMLIQAGLPKAF
jgi:hypothetical protein